MLHTHSEPVHQAQLKFLISNVSEIRSLRNCSNGIKSTSCVRDRTVLQHAPCYMPSPMRVLTSPIAINIYDMYVMLFE